MEVREKLVELLSKYFNIGDSYTYNLTRVKSAFACGTVGLDDFEEFNDETVKDITSYLIANGVTVQEWISVKDRLPEDYKQRVMVICIGDYPIGYPKIDTDRYVRGHWVRYGIYVSHWMPLPQPPKGE